MKFLRCLLLILAPLLVCHGETIQFHLGPNGAGLRPGNEVIPPDSGGSGNEIGAGIFFDASTRILSLNLAYGSAFGFSDLTGPAFAWLLHGPAPLGETAPVLFNLQSFHTFAADPAHGGIITGSLALNAFQETALVSGLTYINIYTPASLGGEIRAQLMVVPEPRTIFMLGCTVISLGFSRFIRRRSSSR